ncbi:hypothetical protein [Actinacidiphila oryziradicis]|uniref:Uncharacterized protein n=1 Tax=Actinacidiphila oryziradicis TaxID=2571141 RepID=A0A4U0RL39_9ACTN|nr:hypothetical protein [Actinacidiphila oryziradicis]TJZ96481.1 hypothetical protein FCI23_50905 [Actinacidiphila oryziradicis]
MSLDPPVGVPAGEERGSATAADNCDCRAHNMSITRCSSPPRREKACGHPTSSPRTPSNSRCSPQEIGREVEGVVRIGVIHIRDRRSSAPRPGK